MTIAEKFVILKGAGNSTFLSFLYQKLSSVKKVLVFFQNVLFHCCSQSRGVFLRNRIICNFSNSNSHLAKPIKCVELEGIVHDPAFGKVFSEMVNSYAQP